MRRYAVLVAFGFMAFLPIKANAYGIWMGPERLELGYSQHHPWDREFTRHHRIAHHGARHARHEPKQYAKALHAPRPLDIRSPAQVASQIVSHPSGCPGRAFCGCGVALRVFGHHVRDLWLARNWFRFPRSAPAAGNVAIFRGGGHVAYIEQVHGDGTATLYDPNSGGHQTRVHRRSLAGAVIVNPNGGYAEHHVIRHRYVRHWHHHHYAGA